MIIAVLLIIGGTWMLQDAVASVLYYLKRSDEKWYFNHAVRILRGIWGLVFIGCGIFLIGGINGL